MWNQFWIYSKDLLLLLAIIILCMRQTKPRVYIAHLSQLPAAAATGIIARTAAAEKPLYFCLAQLQLHLQLYPGDIKARASGDLEN
jgi:hypothetical protein